MLNGPSSVPLICRVIQAFPGVAVGLLALLFVRPGLTWSEPFESAGWQHYREIRVPRTVEVGMVGVALEANVIEASRSDLADLRVVSSAGEVVPLAVTDLFHDEVSAPFPVSIFKIVKRPGKWTDLWIDKKAKILSRGVVIQTTSKNFVRKVEIRGSDTGVEEYVIHMDGLVFDIPGPVPIQSLELLHPVNNFRYIHLRFLDGEHPPLKLEGALCRPPPSSPAPAPPVELRLMENRTNAADNSTVLVADLGEKRFPISKIRFSSPNKGFTKKARLSKKGPGATSWLPFYEGTVFRIERAEALRESLELRFDPQNCRYVMVELSGPGPAVQVRSLEAFSAGRLAIFEFQPDLTYRLLYGNPQAKASGLTGPDPAMNFGRILTAAAEITLGEEQKNVPLPRPAAALPQPKAKPSSGTVWKVVGIVLLLIGLVLLFATMLRSRTQRRVERRRGSRFLDTRL
jgi:hypothetical protein